MTSTIADSHAACYHGNLSHILYPLCFQQRTPHLRPVKINVCLSSAPTSILGLQRKSIHEALAWLERGGDFQLSPSLKLVLNLSEVG